MKRALLSGLLTFLALLPSNEASANYRTEKGHNGRIESTIMDYTTKESISLRTVWSDEIDGVIVSNYPNIDWNTSIRYDAEKNAVSFQIAAPENIHRRYVEMFNRGIEEVEKKEKKRKDNEEKLKVVVMHIQDISPGSNGKEVTCYWAEMEDTPIPKWKISIKDYTNDNNPPEIDIKPDKDDLYMLLNIYKEKRREHEFPILKLEF